MHYLVILMIQFVATLIMHIWVEVHTLHWIGLKWSFVEAESLIFVWTFSIIYQSNTEANLVCYYIISILISNLNLYLLLPLNQSSPNIKQLIKHRTTSQWTNLIYTLDLDYYNQLHLFYMIYITFGIL